ncbi:MAG: TRAP transporter small permease [Lachnospiraceae bacterium]|nr:TRAP transporter small permease [Lachnospiraceae bacterium]
MILDKLRRFTKRWEQIELAFLTALFAIAFVIIILQIVSRYIFNSPIIWTDELSSALQMFIAFLAIGYGILSKTHIRTGGFITKWPKAVKHIITIVSDILFIFVCYKLLTTTIPFVRSEWNIPFGTFPLGRGKMFIAVPIGYGTSILYLVMEIIEHILEWFYEGKDASVSNGHDTSEAGGTSTCL